MTIKLIDKFSPIVLLDGVLCYVHPITIEQHEKLRKLYPAFTSAVLSKRAEKERATYVLYDDGSKVASCFTTSSPMYDNYDTFMVRLQSAPVYIVDHMGLVAPYYANRSNYGLRIGLHLKYDENSKVTKSCHNMTKTASICNTLVEYSPNVSYDVKITSIAPIVTFGKVEYVWLNKDECENECTQIMDLVSVEMVARSVAFTKNKNYSNYAEAVKLQNQCVTVALQDCDEEELSLLVKGILPENENYQRWVVPKAVEVYDLQDDIPYEDAEIKL